MAGAYVPNIAKGRWAEFIYRVENDDPTNSVVVVMLLRDTSLPTDAQLLDADSFDAIISTLGATECSVTSYARKVLTQADINLYTVDDTNDRVDWDLTDQTWTALESGQSIQAVVVGYDNDSTGGTDANIIPFHILTLASAEALNGEDAHWRPHTDGVNRAA